MGVGGALSAQSQAVVSPPGSQAVGSVGFLSSLLVTASGQQPHIGQPGHESAAVQHFQQQQHNQSIALAQAQAHRSAYQAAPQPRHVSDFASMTAGSAHPGVNGLVAGMQGLALKASLPPAQVHQIQHSLGGKSQAPMHQQQPQHPGSANKVFVGGLSWETSDAKLRQYFENYGEVLEAFVSYDKNTGRPRGFGFVVFAAPSVADKVVSLQHTIDRREVRRGPPSRLSRPAACFIFGVGSASTGTVHQYIAVLRRCTLSRPPPRPPPCRAAAAHSLHCACCSSLLGRLVCLSDVFTDCLPRA